MLFWNWPRRRDRPRQSQSRYFVPSNRTAQQTCGRRQSSPTAAAEAIDAAHGEAFDLLLGRRTYDIFSGYWPKAENSPMADSLNAATKYVATHRPDSLGWGPVADLGPEIVEGIRRIKAKDGPDLIVWGSSTLTPVLLEHGLADEVLLLVYPIRLGTGKRFFSDGAPPRELRPLEECL